MSRDAYWDLLSLIESRASHAPLTPRLYPTVSLARQELAPKARDRRTTKTPKRDARDETTPSVA